MKRPYMYSSTNIYIVAELSLTHNSQYAPYQLYGETNKIPTRLLAWLEVWLMPTSDLRDNLDKTMANNIVSASIQLLSSSDSSTDSLGKYNVRLPTQSSSSSSSEEPSLSSPESSSLLAVTALPSLPPINVWLPIEDYNIGHWLPYFDDCQGNDHLEKETSNLLYHCQLGRCEKKTRRCVLFLLVGC
jgi:hypothetical protein